MVKQSISNYRPFLSSLIVSFFLLILASCGGGGGSGGGGSGGGDTTPPTVSSTVPTINATGAGLSSAFAATFSEALNPATISTASFSVVVTSGGAPVSGTVSYNGVTATFTPDSVLPGNTQFTATLTGGAGNITDLAGNPLAADYVWSFTTGIAPDGTPPTVSSTVPTANATGVSLNSAVTATFSEALNPATISTATFSVVVTSGGAPVSGAVTYNGVTATFTPGSALAGDTQFTATLTGGTGNIADLADNVLVADYVWSFTTGPAPDSTSPTVSSTVPTANATGVSLNSAVAATFSEALNPATISTATFSVVVTSGGAPVSGAVTYNGVTATFTPSSALPADTQLTATLTGGAGNIADLAGNPLAASYTWSFTTGPAPDSTSPTVSSTVPTTNATGVSLNSAISATFSEALDPATISTASFSVVVTSGGAPVSGTVTYNGVTATFTPSSALPGSTQFTATLTGTAGNIADLAGNPLATDYVWSFTAGAVPDSTSPTVSSTVPTTNATGVSLNSAISATFSEALNPATISTATFSVVVTSGGAPVPGTVTYNGVTATFTPSSALPGSTQFTATLTGTAGNITDLAGNPLTTNYVWSFTTVPPPDITPPAVSSTVPTTNATGVSLNSTVTATFSEALDPATISTASFTVVVTSGGATVSGTVSYNGVTATFTPDSVLPGNTQFTATLAGGVGNITDLAGNPLAASYVWSFTTQPDLILPDVISPLSPVSNATNVATNTNVSATFSEPITPGSVVFLLNGPGGAVSTSPPALTGNNDFVTINPAASLENNTTYVATISAARDIAGNNLAMPFSWSFTTVPAPDTAPPTVSSHTPIVGATGVSINSAISIIFSESMNLLTINETNITIDGGVSASSVTYSGVTAVFTPSVNLANNTTYTVTVTTGATDVAGNPIAANYTFSFTTAAAPDTTPPTVSSTVPATNATGISLNSAVTATFSEALNPATIILSTFSVVETIGGAPVLGAVTYNGVTATFTPDSDLAGDTQFTATLTGGGGNIADLAGNVLVGEYAWSFTTGPIPDTTPPTVESTVPADTATVIATNTAITALFSEAIDPATINTSNFSVYDNTNSLSVSGTVTYNGLTATFTPNTVLANDALHTVALSGVTDTAGNSLPLTNWTFTTAAAPDITNPSVNLPTVPADTATNVDITTAISATFDEPMDAATLSTATFTVNDDTNMLAVSGTVTYDGTTATFQPDAVLAFSADITATINGATDLAGNPLPLTNWTFTISAAPDTTGPQITSTSPVNSSTDISLRPTITVKFSELIDCATLLDSSLSLTGGAVVTFTASCGADTATFIPTSDLTVNTTYTATLNGSITDIAANVLVAGSIPNPWTFTTAPELWTVQFGSDSHDQVRGVVTDTAGNVYITGSTLGNMDDQVNAGGNDIFLTKYSPAGERLWTRFAGTNRTDVANALAVDSADNIYIAGYSRGDLNGETNNNFTKDVAVIKYDATGARLWTRLLGTGSDDFASAITIDGSDNIYVTGTTFGDFDGASSMRNGSEFFLLKLASSGAEQWRTQLGSSNDIVARGITTIGTNVYVVGHTNGGLAEPVARTNSGATDIFLARFSTAIGTLDLSQLYGNSADNLGHGIVAFGTDLYITGNTKGGLKGLGGVNVPSIGLIDAFLMQTDTAGVVQWTRIIGTSADDLGRGVTVDSSGGIYITGYTVGSFTGAANAGSNDLFVTKYDTSGATAWATPVVRQLGSAADDTARAITTYSTAGVTDVFVVGETLGALDGNVSFGLSDFFAVKYDGATGTKN